MSDKIEFVLELTRDEALGLLALVGPTHGMVGYGIYNALYSVLEKNTRALMDEAEARFPRLASAGEFT
jgi:hypothetical protein